MSVRLLLSALVLLVASSSPVRADDSDLRQRDDVLWSEFLEVRTDIEARMKELAEVRSDYTENGITEEHVARRQRIRGDISPLLTRASELKQELRVVNDDTHQHMLELTALGLLKGMMPEDAPKEIGQMKNAEQHFYIAHDFDGNIIDDLRAEQKAFDALRAAIKRKAWLARAAAGTGVVAVAGMIALAWKKRPLRREPGGKALRPPLGGPNMPELLDGNFRLGSQIGSGGMGLVFAATDEALGRKVAIKRMKKEVLENRRELDMFMEEARLVAALKHPALVEIHSIVRESGQLYLIFEYVEGKTLKQLLEDEGHLSCERTLGLLRQVAAGLDYAHSKKIIHRDLKPANIMVGKNDIVKVMDFGLAHQAKKTVAKLTSAVAWGTPSYMSPEQELGKVSRESDIYSLGVVYYEMLTGEQVFMGPDYLKQKRELDYEPATKLQPELPASVDAIVRKALNPDPGERFHSGAEFVAAIEAAS